MRGNALVAQRLFQPKAVRVGKPERIGDGMGGISAFGQKRRQPQQAVARREIVGVDLHQPFQPWQLQCTGQQFGQDAGRRHHPQHRCGISRFQQAQQFLCHPLRRQRLQLVLGLRRGAQTFGIHIALAIPGVEAEQPQHPEIVLRDARMRIAHEAHPAGDQVFHPGGIVENLAAGGGIERIDGEIAPRRIFRPVVGEGDHRMAAIGLDVAAQGGDLECLACDNGGDGAVIHAGFDHLDVPGHQPGQHFAGRHGHGDVDIGHVHAQQRVAHGTAHKARFAQGVHDGERFGRRHPGMLGRINSHAIHLYHLTAAPD